MKESEKNLLRAMNEPYTCTLLEQYIEKLKNPADQTNYVSIFSDFYMTTTKDFIAADSEAVEKYISVLKNRYESGKVKYSTITKSFKVLSGFASYILNEKKSRQEVGRFIDDSIVNFRNLFSDFPIKPPEEKFSYEKVPTLEQLDMLIGELKKEEPQLTYIAVLLAFRCFLRTSEILALRTDDIIYGIDGQYYIKVLKRGELIPLPEDITDVLDNYLKHIPDGFLMRTPKTDHLTRKNLDWKLVKACDRAEIPHYSLNDLRNAAAVFAASNGAGPNTLASSMGLKTRSHLSKLSSLKVNLNTAEKYINIHF